MGEASTNCGWGIVGPASAAGAGWGSGSGSWTKEAAGSAAGCSARAHWVLGSPALGSPAFGAGSGAAGDQPAAAG